jgi:hypothetical protein
MRSWKITTTVMLISSLVSGCGQHTPDSRSNNLPEFTFCTVPPGQIESACRAGEWILLPALEPPLKPQALAYCDLDSPVIPASVGISDEPGVACRYSGAGRKVWATTRNPGELMLVSPPEFTTTRQR